MQKLKKTLKKSPSGSNSAAKSNKSSPLTKATQAAKKAPSVKKKSAPAPAAKKAAPKKQAAPIKKAAPAGKGAKAVASGPKKDAHAADHKKKSSAPAAAAPAKKASEKAPAAQSQAHAPAAPGKAEKAAKPQPKTLAGAAPAAKEASAKKPAPAAAVEAAEAHEEEAPKKPLEAGDDEVAAKAKPKKEREEPERVETAAEDDEVILTDAEGRRYCRVKDCDQASTVDGYCRYHYLLFWKNIQNRKKILSEGKLERYIEELTARYPDKYLELLRKDLRSEKDFTAAIQELEIDDSGVDNEFEDEAQSYLDEVRGMSSEGGNEREEDF